jgi:hypothetical protein
VLPQLSSPIAPELLRAKYAEMLAMRLAHEAGEEDPEAVRHRMVELALRYPGALREIDELVLGDIRERIEALDRVVRGQEDMAEWMDAIGLFHALMRGALSVKRWLAGRKHVDAAVEEGFACALAGLAFPDDARAWQSELARIASPPRGRVSALVFERVAKHLGTSEARARRLVFGNSEKRRHAPRATPRPKR